MWGFIDMSYHLIDNFNMASMKENFQTKKCFIEFNSKPDIGLERGGQTNLHVIT